MSELELQGIEMPKVHPINTYGRIHVIQVGAGGTGGYIVPMIARMLSTMPTVDWRYTIIEHDIFEEKNLARQLCIPADIGKNKGEVLVNRYSRAFGLPASKISFVPTPLLSLREIPYAHGLHRDHSVLILDCVDRAAPRKIIKEYADMWKGGNLRTFHTRIPLYTISCGNSQWSGQVAIGATVGRHNRDASSIRTMDIPTAYHKMPELIDIAKDREEDNLSCADRAAANVQNIATNNTAATLAFNYAATIINNVAAVHEASLTGDENPRSYIRVGMVKFDAATNVFNQYLLTKEYLDLV